MQHAHPLLEQPYFSQNRQPMPSYSQQHLVNVFGSQVSSSHCIVTGSLGNGSFVDELVLEVYLRTQHKRVVKGRPTVLPGRHADDQVSFICERDLGKIV